MSPHLSKKPLHFNIICCTRANLIYGNRKSPVVLKRDEELITPFNDLENYELFSPPGTYKNSSKKGIKKFIRVIYHDGKDGSHWCLLIHNLSTHAWNKVSSLVYALGHLLVYFCLWKGAEYIFHPFPVVLSFQFPVKIWPQWHEVNEIMHCSSWTMLRAPVLPGKV